MSKYTVKISGDTKPVKENLKRIGFRWDPVNSEWTQPLEAVFAERLLEPDSRADALKALTYAKKGCRVVVVSAKGSVEVFRSKTYADAGQVGKNSAECSYQRDVYNRDAHGNAVRSLAILGSDPTDRV